MLDQMAEMLAGMTGFAKNIAGKQRAKCETLFHGLYDLSDEEAKAKKVGGGTTLYYFKEMGQHPAESYLEHLTKPLLVLQGGMDFQVKPDVDYAMHQQLLSGRENATFRLYPKLNHVFMPGIYGSITKAKQEYRVEQRMSGEVIADIAAWIHEN